MLNATSDHQELRGYPETLADALPGASVIVEDINQAGGNSGACHGRMHDMGPSIPPAAPSRRATGRGC